MADVAGGSTTLHSVERDARAQLPMPAVEGALAVVLVLGVVVGFALGVPQPNGTQQLDAYAEDAATILTQEPPRHRGGTRLAEVMESADAFEREHIALDRRVGRILPDNVMFRIETPYGRVGHRKPARVATGTATVPTRHGDLTIRVWYA
jgi:hypothetical protein